MEITTEKLRKRGGCLEGIPEFEKHYPNGGNLKSVIDALLKNGKLEKANWLLAHIMDKTQKSQYVIYAAEQMLSLFEAKYPNDKRPRNAINLSRGFAALQDVAYADAYLAAKDAEANNIDVAAYAAAAVAQAIRAINADDAISTFLTAAYAITNKKTMVKIVEYGTNLLLNNC